MYHFFLLNSKIVIDFPERYVLEPTIPNLQSEVRYVEGRKRGGKGGRVEYREGCHLRDDRLMQEERQSLSSRTAV